MKLPFLSKKKKKQKLHEEYFLTLDIGSHHVKCLAFKYESAQNSEIGEKGKIRLIGVGREWLEPRSVRNGYIIETDSVVDALDSAIYKATETAGVDVNNVIFGVSGDICTSLVTTGLSIRGRNDEITLKELNAIDLKITDEAYKIGKAKIFNKTGNNSTNLEIITTSTVYTKVDGKVVSNPVGVRGQKIELALYTSFVPDYYLESLEEVASILNLNVLAITSNLYALTETLKLKEGSDADFVLIDVGSDTTDIGIVFRGGIVAENNVDLGGGHFTKQISTRFGIAFPEAEKKKYQYTFERLDEDQIQETEKVICEVANMWIEGVRIVLEDFSRVKAFPNKIFLTGGGSKIRETEKFLKSELWRENLIFKEDVEIKKLETKHFEHLLDSDEFTEHAELTIPLSLAIVYLELIEGNKK